MKYLFAWEHGEERDFIFCSRQAAESLRRLDEDAHIIVASGNGLTSSAYEWADQVLGSPGIRIKSSHKAQGLWQQLHNSGWTDPDIRETQYANWAQLLRHEKPSMVFTHGSASLTLMCVMEDIRVINIGVGGYIAEPSDTPDDSGFPELQSWIYQFTERKVSELLHKPALIFSDPRIDRQRTGVFFHIKPEFRSTQSELEHRGIEILSVFSDKNERSSEITDQIQALYGDKALSLTKDDWMLFGKRIIKRARTPIVISDCDPLVFSMALTTDAVHIGMPLSNHQKVIAQRSEDQRLGRVIDYQANIEEEIVRVQMAQVAYQTPSAGYCPIDNAMIYFMGSLLL